MDERRFVELWMRAGSTTGEEKARRVYREIVAYYEGSHRCYHRFDHVRHCLRQVDRIPADYPNKTAVELAIWFHDVIYEIGDPLNERNSADWFRARAEDDLPGPLVEQVYRLIVATEHREPPSETDAGYVVDIDLSSFGLPYEEFLADSRAVRAESVHLTDDQFYAAQREFLSSLMKREKIYQTPLFNALLEEQARDNIRRTIEYIDDRLG